MDRTFHWIVRSCIVPTLQQGGIISIPLLVSGAMIRVCVLLQISDYILHALVAIMGMCLLLYFYSNGIIYFLLLCGIVYFVLVLAGKHRGIAVAVISVLFLIIRYGMCFSMSMCYFCFCSESFVSSPVEWHQVRGILRG